MLYFTLLFVSFFLIALILRFYRRVFHAMAEGSLTLLDALLADVDEEVKLKQMEKGTTSLSLSLLKVLLLIVLAFIIGGIPLILYALIHGVSLVELDFTSFYSILVLSAGATLAFVMPIGKKKSSYPELAQLLHRMALDNYTIGNRLFRREVKKMKKKGVKAREDFIIISGLARAGTTSLMNDLAKVDELVSLNYANMPFLMSPNTWAKFYRPKAKKLKERSHKDGIMIGYDSNEALEEYFFKLKADDAYIHEEYLEEYDLPEQDYRDYLDYQSIIRKDNNRRYLAKNNNFILRYRALREFNPNFLMVILFRDPLTQAASLMEKHKDYCKFQDDDPFVLEYMNWLGHHEFGKGQRPFLFDDTALPIESDRGKLDYWLQLWIAFYRHVLEIEHPKTLFINYADFCEQPDEVVSQVLSKAGVDASPPGLTPFRNKRNALTGYSEELHREAMEIFEGLKQKSPATYATQ